MAYSKSKELFQSLLDGNILYNFYHDSDLDRTQVILYVKIPEKYKLVENLIKTKPKTPVKPNNIKQQIKDAVNDYNTSDKNKGQLKNALDDIPNAHQGYNPKTEISFLVYPDENALERTVYREYILNGEDHDVKVFIDPAKGLDLDFHIELKDFDKIAIP